MKRYLITLLVVILIYKFINVIKLGELTLSVEEIVFYSATILLTLNYVFKSKSSSNNLQISDDSEYEEVSWSEYWERYEKEESIAVDIFAWTILLFPFLIFMYGFYQNETVYFWSRYAIITLQVIGILFLISVPANGIIKLISSDKISNIVSLIVNLIIMIVGIYTGDWVLAIVMFAGFMIFMNKVFA